MSLHEVKKSETSEKRVKHDMKSLGLNKEELTQDRSLYGDAWLLGNRLTRASMETNVKTAMMMMDDDDGWRRRWRRRRRRHGDDDDDESHIFWAKHRMLRFPYLTQFTHSM